LSKSEEVLQILDKCQQNSFVTLLTGDESLFFSEYPESRTWVASPDDISDQKEKKNDAKKDMISLVCGIAAIKSLIAQLKGLKYNPQFVCQQFVPDLKSNICSGTRQRILKGHLIDLENALFQFVGSSTVKMSITPNEKRKFQFDPKQKSLIVGDQLFDRLGRCP
jgi:hypothetical protein